MMTDMPDTYLYTNTGRVRIYFFRPRIFHIHLRANEQRTTVADVPHNDSWQQGAADYSRNKSDTTHCIAPEIRSRSLPPDFANGCHLSRKRDDISTEVGGSSHVRSLWAGNPFSDFSVRLLDGGHVC